MKTAKVFLLAVIVLILYASLCLYAFAVENVTGAVTFLVNGEPVTTIDKEPEDKTLIAYFDIQNNSSSDINAVAFTAVYMNDGTMYKIVSKNEVTLPKKGVGGGTHSGRTAFNLEVSSYLFESAGTKIVAMVWNKDTQEDIGYGKILSEYNDYEPSESFTDSLKYSWGNNIVEPFENSRRLYLENRDRVYKMPAENRQSELIALIERCATIKIHEVSTLISDSELTVPLDDYSDYFKFALYNAQNMEYQFSKNIVPPDGFALTVELNGTAPKAVTRRRVSISEELLSLAVRNKCYYIVFKTTEFTAVLNTSFLLNKVSGGQILECDLFTDYSYAPDYMKYLNGAKIYSIRLTANGQTISGNLPADNHLVMYVNNMPIDNHVFVYIDQDKTPPFSDLPSQAYCEDSNTVKFPIMSYRHFTNVMLP